MKKAALAVAALFLASTSAFAQTATKTQETPKKNVVTVYVRIVAGDTNQAGDLFFQAVAEGFETGGLNAVMGKPNTDDPNAFEVVFHVVKTDENADAVTLIVLAHTKDNQFPEYIDSGSGTITVSTAETAGASVVSKVVELFTKFVVAKGTTKGTVN